MKFEINLTGFKLNAQAIRDMNIPKVANQELLTTRTRLVGEAQSGRDANGGSLRDYSPGYKKMIEAGKVKGWNGVRKVSTRTNLTITGELMRSMQVRAIADGAELVFFGTHATTGGGSIANATLANALYDKGFRGWFQFGKPDLERAEKAVLAALDRALKNV